jgi:hypothetical protein
LNEVALREDDVEVSIEVAVGDTSQSFTPCISLLGGVVVSVLASGPKLRGFNPGRGDGYVRAHVPSDGNNAGGPMS